MKQPSRWETRGAALLLLLLAFAHLLTAATRLSATVDEGFHITSGYEYLRTGRLRLFDEHTPLVKALFAWPLFFVPDLASPEQAPGYADGNLINVAQATVLAYRPLDRVIVACRIPVALLTLLLAASVYRWAGLRFGATTGLLSLALLAFDPNVLAHGSLATTDMGATAFIFWTLLAFWHHLRSPDRRSWWAVAVLLGLSQGAKLTALILLPILGFITLVDGWVHSPSYRRKRVLLSRIRSYAGMVVVAALVLWALYGFEMRPLPQIAEGHLPIPMASHVERWLHLQTNLDYGRETFLLGQNSMHGWRLYFPVAFLVKTPLPTLILGAIAWVYGMNNVAYRLSRGSSQSSQPPIPYTLLVFPVLYAAASLFSTINIGYRHLLPILPFLYVLLAKPISTWARRPARWRRRLLRAGCVALLLWQMVGTVAIAPHFLAFFNTIAGGPNNGWRFLADSNTDWGQTFKALTAYQKEQNLGEVRLSAFTFYDPAAYGVNYEPIAPMTGAPPVLPQRFNPAAGTYAISATTLDGVPLPYPPTFDWFRHREPRAKVGHVMFVYEVTPLRGEWIAQCTDPVRPLPAETIAAGFGVDDLRQTTFDCTQSWVLPESGRSPGWYAVTIPKQTALRWPQQEDQRDDLRPSWLAQIPLDLPALSYLQPTAGELPPFAIWECDKCDAHAEHAATLVDKLAYLGMFAPSEARRGTTLDVFTMWQVLTRPEYSLSIMLHLRNAQGQSLVVGDALGFPAEQWQPDDIFIQRHTLDVPLDVEPGTYTLHTGAYRLDDLELMPASNPEALVSSIRIKSR